MIWKKVKRSCGLMIGQYTVREIIGMPLVCRYCLNDHDVSDLVGRPYCGLICERCWQWYESPEAKVNFLVRYLVTPDDSSG